MGYVIAAIIVVLLVGGAILFFVRGATSKSNVSDAHEGEGDPRAIASPDDQTPAGDTDQHAEPDGLNEGPGHDDRPDVARPVVGGEGEARRSI